MEVTERYDALRVVYDVPNAYFSGEDFAAVLMRCRDRLELVHLSDTGRHIYRHDPVGEGTLPFDRVRPALAAAGYAICSMPEITTRNPDRDILASAARLVRLGFAAGQREQ